MTEAGSNSAWENLDKYIERYGPDERLHDAGALQKALRRRRAEAAALRRRSSELESELTAVQRRLKAIDEEIEGTERAATLAIDTAIDAVRAHHGETWSPLPVFGFRVWTIGERGLRGARTTWTSPTMTARCLKMIPGEDLPHSTERCGSPPCGVYAAKSVLGLCRELGVSDIDGYAIGLTAMRGKVIEHELGYRGSRADVVALAARFRGRVFRSDDSEVLEEFFRGPLERMISDGHSGDWKVEGVDRYLSDVAERRSKWTWDKS